MSVGEDDISFNLDMTTTSNNPNRFKYSEDTYPQRIDKIISLATYNAALFCW